MEKFIGRSEIETKDIGKKFGKRLKGGDVVVLDGVLGGGKTVFTKGIGEALEISDIITSPSFAILNIYEGRINLYHFDLYRIDDEEEIELLMQDYLYNLDGVTVIEWGKKVEYILDNYYLIEIEIGNEGERIISIGEIIK